MAKLPIANIRGPRGFPGEQGPPGIFLDENDKIPEENIPERLSESQLYNTIAAAIDDLLDNMQLVSGPSILGVGDSLTAGAGGDGTSWPSAVSAIVNAAYSDPPAQVTYNRGIGGETPATIAGRALLGSPWLATVAGGSIPTSGGVTVTLASATGDAVAPLLQGSSGINPVDIAGVRGALSLASGVYTFTRTTSGLAVSAASPTPVVTQTQRERQGDIVVMWMGQNGDQNVESIIGYQRPAIARLKAFKKRWIVLGLSTGTAAARATMEARFLQEYGERFLNIRAHLSSYTALSAESITPTSTDDADIAAGRVPLSLRSDATHLNAAGYRRVGRAVYEKIKALGWNDQWGTLGDDSDTATPTVADYFERTSTNVVGELTPVGGVPWQILSGGNATAPIDAGAVHIALNGDGEGDLFANVGAVNGRVRAVLRTTGGGNAGLLCRMAGLTDYIRINATSGAWLIQQKVANVTTSLATGLGAVADGDVIDFTFVGTVGTLRINDTQVWTGTIPEFGDGRRMAFQVYPSGANGRWESIEYYSA